MRIALVIGNALDQADIPAILEKLDSVDVAHSSISERPPGNISQPPCIAGIDATGIAHRSGGMELLTSDLQAWAQKAPAEIKISKPSILSKTTFNNYAANVLGAGDFMAGADAFQAIIDACEQSLGRAKFCFTQYMAALSVEKSEVDLFTSWMVAASTMTTNQRKAILDNWPEA